MNPCYPFPSFHLRIDILTIVLDFIRENDEIFWMGIPHKHILVSAKFSYSFCENVREK